MTHRALSNDSEWNFELVERYDREIARVAADYRLDTYPVQLEVISAEQMMDAYASVGMPVGYHHWSHGKEFVNVERRYRRGQMGLAYEIVINSDPCIAYLMEENTMTMQGLVIAHAAYGHNSFFKGNYLFRTWTSADSIIDYLIFARDYIRECERRHGEETVELFLDSCHALLDQGVDLYKRPPPLSAADEENRIREREAYRQRQMDEIWRTLPQAADADAVLEPERFPAEPQENLLYFIEKNAPLLEAWQREIVRIVRKLAQYFYPQRQTKVMNEGWACFWHYTLLNSLYEQGYLSDGFMIEFLQSHTNVIRQPAFDEPGYGGINPYALGFSMMCDIRRICESPPPRIGTGSPASPGPIGGRCSTSRCATSKTKASSPSICHRTSFGSCACSHFATTTRARTSWSPPFTTKRATVTCDKWWRASTISSTSSPTSRCGTWIGVATAR